MLTYIRDEETEKHIYIYTYIYIYIIYIYNSGQKFSTQIVKKRAFIFVF